MFNIVIPKQIVFNIFRIVSKIFYNNIFWITYLNFDPNIFGHIIFVQNVKHNICRFRFPYYNENVIDPIHIQWDNIISVRVKSLFFYIGSILHTGCINLLMKIFRISVLFDLFYISIIYIYI